MVDLNTILAKYRAPWRRDRLAQAAALAPALRIAARNPVLLISAAAVGIAGLVAWRNRGKITAFAGPILEDARLRGGDMIAGARARSGELAADARAKGQELVTEAKARSRSVRSRKAATPPPETTEIY